MATGNRKKNGKQSVSDSFDALELRFMSVMSRLQVLSGILGDCANVPNELAPAAYVLHETTDELVQLTEDLESWHGGHDHTPKAQAVQKAAA